MSKLPRASPAAAPAPGREGLEGQRHVQLRGVRAGGPLVVAGPEATDPHGAVRGAGEAGETLQIGQEDR